MMAFCLSLTLNCAVTDVCEWSLMFNLGYQGELNATTLVDAVVGKWILLIRNPHVTKTKIPLGLHLWHHKE